MRNNTSHTTFFSRLVREGNDHNSTLAQHLGQTLLSSSTHTNINNAVEELSARGRMEQIIMFLTGPAGAGNQLQ